MDLRHPVQTLQWAMTHALESDLSGDESAAATGPLVARSVRPVVARPAPCDCSVVLFTQAWTPAELGFGPARGETSIDAETVVITGPQGDACVYVSTQLLYRVSSPNRRFFLDVAAQHMRGKQAHHTYEGRDTADEEAFDYEVAGALARVCGVVQRAGRDDARRVAAMLRRYLNEIERSCDSH